MDSILSYVLTTNKKARFVAISQRGQLTAKENRAGSIATLQLALPPEYDQGQFPEEIAAQARRYRLESTDRNVLIYSSPGHQNRHAKVTMLFAPALEAYIAVGFADTAIQVDYYELMQSLFLDLDQRGAFNLQQPRIQLNYDQNEFDAQDLTLFGLQLNFIQRVSFYQKQQVPLVCFADASGPDFEFLIQKLASFQRKAKFVFVTLIVKNLIIERQKKADGVQVAQSELRKLTQRAKFINELNVVADYPGLLDAALSDVQFCYQLFFPSGLRFRNELGCLVDQIERDLNVLITENEEILKEDYKKQKIRHLKQQKYELMDEIDQMKLVKEIDQINRQRVQARRMYYRVQKSSELDQDMLVDGNKVLFSGMELTLIRQSQEQNGRNIIMAVCDEQNLQDFVTNLKDFLQDYFVIFLIKDCWQFNVRKLDQQFKLAAYNILADEFGVYERVTKVCERAACLVKVRSGKIQKVVASVVDLADTDEEIKQFTLENKKEEEERRINARVEEYRSQFEQLDINQNGVLELEEIRALAQGMGHDPEDLLALADRDGSGVLGIDEFADMMVILEA
ncbi:Conserved_hypothetical protein [Hexamita inflata]|uniref:EF-hand domain-containing protein n=1 Tax=Hexamita inflata TaxID=28002 RepID=A0AA86TXK1_9EUKA|nr:Conserved hypothetical protein [Hexamita inflata]CAI9932126.1 Conserved hypothetical protein [Hexamita inflata]